MTANTVPEPITSLCREIKEHLQPLVAFAMRKQTVQSNNCPWTAFTLVRDNLAWQSHAAENAAAFAVSFSEETLLPRGIFNTYLQRPDLCFR